MSVSAGWIPADAGMTDEAWWVCPNSIDDGYSQHHTVDEASLGKNFAEFFRSTM